MRSEPKQPHARMFAREEGMTLVEVVVAGLIFVIGALAILQTFESSTRSAYRAEQSQVLNAVAERELEEIRRLPFAQVALATPAPTSATAENDPRRRVSGTRFALSPNGTNLADMVLNGGGLDTDGDGQLDDGTITCGSSCLVSGPEPFSSGDVKGNIYRYVVWQDDVSCGAALPGRPRRQAGRRGGPPRRQRCLSGAALPRGSIRPDRPARERSGQPACAG